MEILKTKIAIMGSELTILRNSEIKTLANRARYRIDLSTQRLDANISTRRLENDY